MKILYTAEVTVQGGREGHAHSSDGKLDVDLRLPEAMGGGSSAGTNPEQLFAAGYAACFQSALEQSARRQQVAISPSTIKAIVGIGPNGERGFGLDVELHIFIPGVDRATSEKLAEVAHQICPYSNATRGNIPVRLIIEEQPNF